MTPFEIVVAGRMIEQGYEMYNSGWPDFCFVRREGGKLEVRFVEVKTASDEVRANQKQMHGIFQELGIPVEVVYEDSTKPMTPVFGDREQRAVGRPDSALQSAIVWLRGYLHPGIAVRARQVLTDAKEGAGISNDTLRKAAQNLHVHIFQEGAGRTTTWFWRLGVAAPQEEEINL